MGWSLSSLTDYGKDFFDNSTGTDVFGQGKYVISQLDPMVQSANLINGAASSLGMDEPYSQGQIDSYVDIMNTLGALTALYYGGAYALEGEGAGAGAAEAAAGGGAGGGAAAGAGAAGGSAVSGGTAAGTGAAAGGTAAGAAGGSSMSWIGPVASAVIGGAIDYNAAGDAAAASEKAAKIASDTQLAMYGQTRADQTPWREAGGAAVNQLGKLYGLNGQAPDMSAFYASPDYKFRLDEGMNALDRSAASRGRLFSGAQLKGAQDYGQAAASQEFGNYFNRLAGIAGVGQTSVSNTGAAGTTAASNAGDAMMAAGNARASGYLGQAKALNNALNQSAYYYGYGG